MSSSEGASQTLHVQVGSTPAGVELPRCVVDEACQNAMQEQSEGNRATLPPGADVKWRYMWRIGPRPADTQFAELNSPAIVPAGKGWLKMCQAAGAACSAAAACCLVCLGFLVLQTACCDVVSIWGPTRCSQLCTTCWQQLSLAATGKHRPTLEHPCLAGFPDWARVMDGWGDKMLAALHSVAQLAALGLGLPEEALMQLMHQGPHLLAPTGGYQLMVLSSA